MIESLRALLLDYSQADGPAKREEVEKKIWDQFGVERSVLVVDMSGFSALTRRHGLVHFLSMVRRMQETVRPIIHDHTGSVVKFEADNAFATFPDPESALRAAIEMNKACHEDNRDYSDEYDIELSCGIDHGRILLLEGKDFFGDAVNTASKLGEDLAVQGEILISKSSFAAITSELGTTEKEVSFSISGLPFEAVSIQP